MKVRFLTWAVITSAITLASPGVAAKIITPVTVQASSTFYTYNKNNLINDSGLDSSTFLHDGNPLDMWMSNQSVTATLTFDLGGVYDLIGTDIWQYNNELGYNTRGVKNFDILTSLDNIFYQPVLSTQLTKSTGIGKIAPEFRSFTRSTKYVKFSILSNYGSSYTGLSEVKFESGLPAIENAPPPAVAEPSVMLLFALSILGWTALRAHKSYCLPWA
jgi:hypothetical protein